MAKGLEEAKSALIKVKDEYTLYYNQHHEPAPEFEVGVVLPKFSLVWF